MPAPWHCINVSLALFENDRRKLEENGKPTAATLSIHNYFQSHPITNTTKIKDACVVSLPTVLRSLASLEQQGIIEEITGKDRHKVFVYRAYLNILGKGTEPLKY